MSRGRVRVELSPSPAGETREQPRRAELPEPSTPFRILVLGDFSGDAGARHAASRGDGGSDGAGLDPGPVPFDRDDVDRALRAVEPALRLRFQGAGRAAETVRFESLEDFHPDRLYERMEVFRELGELRSRLASGGDVEVDPSSSPGNGRPPSDGTPAGGGKGLLNRVVDETSGDADPPDDVPGSDELEAYVRRIVGPHLVPEPDPERRAALDRVEASIEQTMRAVLHDPGFQALEAAWRSVRFMARRIETGPRLKLCLLDVSAETLRADLLGASGSETAGLRRVLGPDGADAAGGHPWALVVGLYAFGPEDLDLIAGLAKTARAAGAPFVGGATPELAGLTSEGGTLSPADASRGRADRAREAWRELRERPEARWLGLALPRLLLRPPYGESTRPCEAFPFEEMEAEAPPAHEDYLWGPSAAGCAVLIARSFASDGWSLRPGRHRDLDRLPLHLYRAQGESRVTPSAEFRMSERVASGLLEDGFMPLAWIEDRPSARLVRFQSIARPSAPLAGRWGGA